MSNGFELHGIDHLSASSLNTWVAEPALWVMERLLKKSAPVGVSAHRGTAIERGIEVGLFNPALDTEDCQAEALKEFDNLTKFFPAAARDKERAILRDAVRIGLDELRQYGIPSTPEQGRQHKITVMLGDIPVPFVGYLDFLYDQHGILIDLKTEHRLSSQIKPGHARQVAIYTRAKQNHEARVAYVTGGKVGVYRLEPEIADKAINEITQIAARLERFLRLSPDPWELAGLLCPNPETFYWNNQKAVDHRREVYGY